MLVDVDVGVRVCVRVTVLIGFVLHMYLDITADTSEQVLRGTRSLRK